MRGGGGSLAGNTAGPLSYATGVGVRCDDAEGVFWVARRRPVREGLEGKKNDSDGGAQRGVRAGVAARARGVRAHESTVHANMPVHEICKAPPCL